MDYSIELRDIKIVPTSMLTSSEKELQVIAVYGTGNHAGHVNVSCIRDGDVLLKDYDLPVCGGENEWAIQVPPPLQSCEGILSFHDLHGKLLSECTFCWPVPRRWTINVVIGSHTDIGLHNSQYFQRYTSSKFIDAATSLMDATQERAPENQYRYIMEGTWFWNNYGEDRGCEAARRIIETYIKPGRLGIGCALAGNHTHVYGLEEVCRSSYTRHALKEDWQIESSTMTMMDNNGLSWAIVEPYVSAGIRNILFAPNQWNPLPSQYWYRNYRKDSLTWNTDGGGGGTRVDVRYDSDLPMVFYWLGPDEKSKLLVWCSTSYEHGGKAFGIWSGINFNQVNYESVLQKMREMLPKIEKRYAFDRWLIASYGDDQVPDISLTDFCMEWNKRWASPRLVPVGNLDEPFEYLRSHFDSDISVLRGDITSGWCLHPLATPELLAQKFFIDRLLPQAELLNVLACLGKSDFVYARTRFENAWEALLCNDEHSYGVSGYQGRRVYETWMQHRDWLNKAEDIAQTYQTFMAELASQAARDTTGLLIVNTTLQPRENDYADYKGFKFQLPVIPPLGYVFISEKEIERQKKHPAGSQETCDGGCIVETSFYRMEIASDGSVCSLYDKELKRELLDSDSQFNANQFVYSEDTNQHFSTPGKAKIRRFDNELETVVIAQTTESLSEAEIITTVTLPKKKKEILFDNQLRHVRGLYNNQRYHRYGYFAFPFLVTSPHFTASLNGCVASPFTDQTGHGTDTYLPAREWACVENDEFGIALFQLDSMVIEFGQIHPDKTDYGRPETKSGLYSYVFNDWLQMHTHSGDAIAPRFRYKITSYSGNWRSADIPSAAECFSVPLLMQNIQGHASGCGIVTASFVNGSTNGLRLLALKGAEDGDGIIVRLHETFGKTYESPLPHFEIPGVTSIETVTIDEQSLVDAPSSIPPFGYATLRLKGHLLPMDGLHTPHASPLINKPCCACGERPDMMYILWPKCIDDSFDHYELHRSKTPDFTPNDQTLIAHVQNEDYVVARFVDENLDANTHYFYQYCIVDKTGSKSAFSEIFSNWTSLPLN